MTYRVLAAAALAVLMTACGPAAEKPTPAASPAPAAAAPDPVILAALAALPAPYNGADYANGRKVFAQCRTCHTLVAGGPNQVGPNLHGVFGRTAGTVAKFNYSAALKGSGIVWDADKLNAWLADPKGFLPGNRMAFAGVKQADDRRDVIAFLKIETVAK